jgi:putative cell wall-binding protein
MSRPGRELKTRLVAASAAVLSIGAGVLVAAPGSAAALGFIFNQALTAATTVHPGSSGAATAVYQIDTTNSFGVGDSIYLKIEGVANPSTTNAGVGFSVPPAVTVSGPSIGAFGAGAVGDTAHDHAPTFTTGLASSAGAATVVGIKDEIVITVTNSSAGTATDHYTFTVGSLFVNVGSAVVQGNINLHAYTGDGTGSLAAAVTVATVSNKAVNRLSGADRFATAVAISAAEFPTAHTAGAVVLARSDDYPDALVGTTLAAARTAPLLFSSGGSLPLQTQTEIQRVLPAGGTVYLLGGTSAIPASVAATLSSLSYLVVRYAGADRYGTALAVADALGDPSTVLLATGTNFPDALAAGPAAAHAGGIVLLTAGTVLPATVSAYLVAHPGKVYAIGGPAIIADPPATSVVGSDRYATAVAVASRFFTVPTAVGVASGVTFADALAGGPLLAHAGGPLLLSDPNALSASTSGYLTTNKATLPLTWLFGGTNAVSSSVQTQIAVAVGQ